MSEALRIFGSLNHKGNVYIYKETFVKTTSRVHPSFVFLSFSLGWGVCVCVCVDGFLVPRPLGGLGFQV